jgi:uncharacterized protein (TIGR00369 family)
VDDQRATSYVSCSQAHGDERRQSRAGAGDSVDALTENVRGYFDGSIHGGMLATLADAASASCLDGACDFNAHFPVTTDIHVRYYRQPKGGPLRAEAKLVHGGRTLLSTECSVTDAHDQVLIRTTATFMLVPNPKPL